MANTSEQIANNSNNTLPLAERVSSSNWKLFIMRGLTIHTYLLGKQCLKPISNFSMEIELGTINQNSCSFVVASKIVYVCFRFERKCNVILSNLIIVMPPFITSMRVIKKAKMRDIVNTSRI